MYYPQFPPPEQPNIIACQIDHVLFSHPTGGVPVIMIQHLESSSGSVGVLAGGTRTLELTVPILAFSSLMKSKTLETLSLLHIVNLEPTSRDSLFKRILFLTRNRCS